MYLVSSVLFSTLYVEFTKLQFCLNAQSSSCHILLSTFGAMHSVSRRSAKLLVSSWLSEESSYNLPGYDLESSKTVLVIAMKAPGSLT